MSTGVPPPSARFCFRNPACRRTPGGPLSLHFHLGPPPPPPSHHLPPLSSPFQSVGTAPTSRPRGGQTEPRGLGGGGWAREAETQETPGPWGAVGKPGRTRSRTGGCPLSGVPCVPPRRGPAPRIRGWLGLGAQAGWGRGPLSKELLPLGRREAGSQAPWGRGGSPVPGAGEPWPGRE